MTFHLHSLLSSPFYCGGNLRHISLSSCKFAVNNEILKILGQTCSGLTFLDVSECNLINDVGVQALVFPEAVLKAGKINLANSRIRTNPLAKHLRVSTEEVRRDEEDREQEGMECLLLVI